MLVRLSPSDCIRSGEHQRGAGLSSAVSLEQRHAIVGSDDMARTTCFARAQANSAGVDIVSARWRSAASATSRFGDP
jgi:hypothetical protein